MEKDRKLHCVVCPNVLKKAKKRAHQKRTTPRSGAPTRFVTREANVRTEDSSKQINSCVEDRKNTGNCSIPTQVSPNGTDHGRTLPHGKESEDASQVRVLDTDPRGVSFDQQADHQNAMSNLRSVQTDAGVIDESDEHQIKSVTGDASSQRGASDMQLTQSSLWDDMLTMDTANDDDGQAASMVHSEKDSDVAAQSEP
jgi:hypothetical protein